MKYLLPLGLLMFVTAAHAAPRHERVTLPNGLTVIAIEDQSSAVAAFHLAVKVNPASIPEKKSGVAALSQQILQHRLQKLLEQEPWQALGEQIGATRSVLGFNTELDHCEARAQVADQQLQPALELAGKLLFADKAATAEEVQAARDVLTNVVQDSSENVVETTYYRFLQALHGRNSPLARPVHGSLETLNALTESDIAGFRTTFIGPNNASLCVVGPRPLSELVALARKTFGDYGRSSSDSKPVTVNLPPESRVSVGALQGWRGVSVMVGVPAPTYGSPDFLKAQLVFTMLEGEYGRLERDQDLKGNLGLNQLMNHEYESSATILPPSATPLPYLVMHMVVTPRLMERARVVMLGHVLCFTEGPPPAEELQAARTRLSNAWAVLQLSRLGFARAVNSYELYGQDYRRVWNVQQELAAITAQDLVDLASRYFGQHAIGVVMPGDEEEQ